MTALHTEQTLEDEICRDLAAAGWLHEAGDAARYDRALALFPDDVAGWIQTTQPEAWASIEQTHGAARDGQHLVSPQRRGTGIGLTIAMSL